MKTNIHIQMTYEQVKQIKTISVLKEFQKKHLPTRKEELLSNVKSKIKDYNTRN